MGCRVDQVTIADAEASGLLDQKDCYYCHRPLADGEMYALEHKKSLFHKGPHTLANLTKSCVACNMAKHVQDELDYLASLDRMS